MNDLLDLYKQAFYGYKNKQEHKATDTEYSYKRTEDGKIYICFQGSTSKIDWLQNFNFIPKKYNGIFYHCGMLKKWLAVKDDIIKLIGSDLAYFTGFSQGGGVAAIATVDLIESGYRVDHGVTFGAPKTIFNKDKTNNIYAVIHNKDVVPMLPPFYPKQRVLKKLQGRFKLWDVYKNHMDYENIIRGLK